MEDFVLVVDDEPSVRNLLQTQLDFLGFSVRTTGETKGPRGSERPRRKLRVPGAGISVRGAGATASG